MHGLTKPEDYGMAGAVRGKHEWLEFIDTSGYPQTIAARCIERYYATREFEQRGPEKVWSELDDRTTLILRSGDKVIVRACLGDVAEALGRSEAVGDARD